MKHSRTLLALALTVTMTSAACGSDDEEATPATSAATTPASEAPAATTADTAATAESTAGSTAGTEPVGTTETTADPGVTDPSFEFPASDEPIKIGVVMSLSGPAATLGKNQAQGAELAAEDLNAAGGLNGRMIELVVKDDESNPERAIAETKALIDEGVQAIVGSGLTSTCYAMEPVVREAEMPTYCMSGAPVPKESTFMFFGLPPNPVFQKLPIELAKDMGVTLGVISTDDATGQLIRDIGVPLAEEAGVEIVGYEMFPVDAQDVSVQISKLQSEDPGLLYIVASGAGPTTTALRGVRDLGWDIPVFLTYSNTTQGFLDAAESVLPEECIIGGTRIYVADQLPPDPSLEPYIEQIDAYTARYGQRPDMFTAESTDALNILSAGIALTDGSGPAVRDWMVEDMGTYNGVTGPIDFTSEDLRGTSEESVILMRCTADGFKPYP